jgi:hypothetical protein
VPLCFASRIRSCMQASMVGLHRSDAVSAKLGWVVLEWSAEGQTAQWEKLRRQPLKLVRIGNRHAGTLDGNPLVTAELVEKPRDCLP